MALDVPDAPLVTPTLAPVDGGRSFFAIADAAGEPGGRVRRYDGASATWGPPIPLRGERFYAAYDVDEGRHVMVTSTGRELCFATFANGATEPEPRACVAASPTAIAFAGGRFALLHTSPLGKAPNASKGSPASPKGAHDRTRTRDAKKGDAKKGDAKKGDAKKGDAKKGDAKKGDAKKGDAKKGDAKQKSDAQKKGAKEAKTEDAGPRPSQEVFLRWVSADGAIDDEAVATGLRFASPQEGMGLVAALGGPRGVDVAWYEPATPPNRGEKKKKKKAAAAAGRAVAIASGRVALDGTFDPATRQVLATGASGGGFIEGHRAPRLVSSGAGPLLVDSGSERGDCDVVPLAASASALEPTRPVCAVEPARAAGPQPLTEDDLAVFRRVLDESPRLATGHRPGAAQVAWALDRGFFLAGDTLRSMSRAGDLRDEPSPFPARGELSWAALDASGEGLARASGKIFRLRASGALEAVALPEPASAAIATDDLARGEPRRAARVRDTFWAARGDVVRVPDGLAASALVGRAHPDSSALVGGARRGLFLELAGGQLRVTALAEDGATTPLGAARAGLRPGFAATERGAGGALVAGVSAVDPTRVVALVVDARGRVGAASPLSLRVAKGELRVALTPLPGGGALLTDAGRRLVVWLDDDGKELAAAEWAAPQREPACPRGRPQRASYPSPEPGLFVDVPAIAGEETCWGNDPVWAPNGTLRWFGTAERGAEHAVEAALPKLRDASPVPAAAEARPLAPTPLRGASCPADMVLVKGTFCVDRFESMLVEAETGRPVSPDYPSTPNLLDFALGEGLLLRETSGDVHARAFPLPLVPGWQRGRVIGVRAVARLGVRPSGYVTGLVAEAACAAAGKRLCQEDELVTACRGEEDTLFPYGPSFVDGQCNVFREAHPASILHGNPSLGHIDPRLNRVAGPKGPLLRLTGETLTCRSRWGEDAIYDLVGNLDEWIDHPTGAFVGGFYSRSTRAGCEAKVAAHPKAYADYSTGIRCCRDAGAR